MQWTYNIFYSEVQKFDTLILKILKRCNYLWNSEHNLVFVLRKFTLFILNFSDQLLEVFWSFKYLPRYLTKNHCKFVCFKMLMLFFQNFDALYWIFSALFSRFWCTLFKFWWTLIKILVYSYQNFGSLLSKFWCTLIKILVHYFQILVCSYQNFGALFSRFWYSLIKIFGSLLSKFWCTLIKILVHSYQNFGALFPNFSVLLSKFWCTFFKILIHTFKILMHLFHCFFLLFSLRDQLPQKVWEASTESVRSEPKTVSRSPIFRQKRCVCWLG